MNKKALYTLEFNKIIDRLSGLAISAMGKEKALFLLPSTDIFDIKKSQLQTSDAVSMSLRKGNLPLGGIKEIRLQLKRVAMGGTLNVEELMHIGEFLYVCRKVKKYSINENKSETYEHIGDLFDIIEPIAPLENEINRCIISEIEVSDRASTNLSTIRRSIKQSNEKVRDHLNNVITSQTYKNMLQDTVITIRNDRYCVPVKLEYRNNFPGLIHDQSNTGSTVFIEPLSVVELNNKIKELQIKEKEEIDKILKELSAKVFEYHDVLSANTEILTELDFIFAKASLSLSMNGTMPVFNNEGFIDIKKARHPLLNTPSVVPIDVNLGKDFTTLLITGPNTGGKTVTLKTLGLFTLMGQAGLHIPAFDNSKLAVFNEVFADIGDEQSIEQSLSTFSSHMTNIVEILENITPNSLVLFDELGAGTDPTEGAALALAISEHLRTRKIRTAITTHYSELKVYAISTDSVENASCEFDLETLRPTYRLLIGIPGKSNAFAISKRLGLKDNIINAAKEFINREDIRLEDVIADLEISKKSVIYEQERAEEYRKEAERLKKDVESQRRKIQEQKEKIIADAKDEARDIYLSAKEEADSIIKEMNKNARAKVSQSAMNESRGKLKDKLLKANNEIYKTRKRSGIGLKPLAEVTKNQKVYITSFDQRGIVESKPDSSGNVMVNVGNMKIKVPINHLVIDDYIEKETKNSNYSFKAKANKSYGISPEVDCRGMTVDEGIGIIDKYLDDAYLSGLKKVTIIHGKGTGALRQAVQIFLSSNPHVKNYRLGTFGEGEMGVTIVELK